MGTHGNHVDAARMLIDAGVNVDHVNRLGWTALLGAVMPGDGSERFVRIVQLLVDGHADVDLVDSNGETPLQHARRRGYGEIERVLVWAGGGCASRICAWVGCRN
ncbi:ankyrin repeat domain-containing protein [Burkholderia cepacia]|uniref:ankyrin repeat domain-containing protein n=1 Tax=Burkholderia cepacia TaxID=292 RepID=UPI003D670A4A